MQIEIKDFVSGAREARGIAVIIDVFRAFSLQPYAFAQGATSCIAVADVDDARKLKLADESRLLVGERHAKKLPGFDCGNSPSELATIDVTSRTLIHTTHAGTQGLVNAVHADQVLTGALVNAAAIVRYIHNAGAKHVTLVRMGHEARERCDEDDLCAELLAARLRGDFFDVSHIRQRLRTAASAEKFFDPACDWAPERDFFMCTEVDRFDFVLRLNRSSNPPSITRVDT